MHTDRFPHPDAEHIVNSALARGVPVVSGRQIAAWVDGRNASTFSALEWRDGVLTFTLVKGAGADNLRAMVPATTGAWTLTALSRDGVAVPLLVEEIKGVEYAVFAGDDGAYRAEYQRLGTPA